MRASSTTGCAAWSTSTACCAVSTASPASGTRSPRARELELERPLFYALRYAARLLNTPVPAPVTAAAAAGRPNRILLALMDRLFGRVLLPDHPSCDDAFGPAARFLLYIRGNWLRMPPLMLARHLFHKAVLSPRPQPVN